MHIANLSGRAVVLVDGGAIDVERLTDGAFGPDPRSLFADWDGFLARVRGRLDGAPAEPVRTSDLGAPVPEPRQVFAIGLNYADHAAEASLAAPEFPVVFTKFASCLTGPAIPVELPSDFVDFEAELVVVIGREARNVRVAEAWSHVAGLMAGQDLSERRVQHRGPAPQWSLAKSYPGFGPTGPALVTLDEVGDPDDLGIRAWIGDELLQDSRTKQFIFPVPVLIEHLSSLCTLLPGDLIFTGTPAGVGSGRTPKRFLRPGETLTTEIEGVGRLETPLVAGSGAGRQERVA